MGYARLSSDFYVRWYAPESPDGLDESHILWCLECMRHHGFDRTVFYDRGDMVTVADWLEFTADEKRMFFCIFENDGRAIAAFWLDMPSTTLRQSFVHFTLLVDPASVDYVSAFRAGTAWVFGNMRIRQLLGLTPVCFRHALGVMRAVGFSELARLKGALEVRGKERDAILSILDQGAI